MERRHLLLWCEIAQGGMQAPSVVPALQELENVSPGFGVRQVVALLDELALQRGIEALHRRIVPAIPLAAHRADDAVLLQSPAVLMRCELHPAIRVMNEARRGTLTDNGHVEGGERQLVAEVVGHGPADCPSSNALRQVRRFPS